MVRRLRTFFLPPAQAGSRHRIILFHFFTALILIPALSFSQAVISGRVTDSVSGKPLPFVSIAFGSTGRGTVANENGEFRFAADTALKSLAFGYIGYEDLEIALPQSMPLAVRLKPLPIDLKEVEVLAGKKSWAGECVASAVKKMKKNRTEFDAKGFFSLETAVSGGDPLEVVEAFYQCSVSPKKGIISTELKNGRLGLAQTEGLWFMDVNPTDVIRNLSLFEASDYRLPASPFALGANEMRKQFRFMLDSVVMSGRRAVAAIRFFPKTGRGRSFSGSVYIDTLTHDILKVSLNCVQALTHPFHPIDTAHRIEGVDLRFTVSYREVEKGMPAHEYVRFDYRMNYRSTSSAFTVTSRSMLLLYDYDGFFILPYFIASPSLNDYGKILTIPYNPRFWERNYIIPASRAAMDHRDYFRKNGLLVNYSGSGESINVLPRQVVQWKPGIRLDWSMIGRQNPGWIVVGGPKSKRPSPEDMKSRRYFMDFQILLDMNPERDSCYWQSHSLLFLPPSFFELERDSFALRVFDLEFDMTELYRLRLEHRLDSVVAGGCDPGAILKTYDRLVKQFESMRALYKKEVRLGRDELTYQTWKKRIDLRLERELKK